MVRAFLRHSPTGIVLAIVMACATFWGIAPKARASDLIYPGVQPKVSAGAGQTVSRGSSALFYNPANLIFSKFIEPDFDISFAKVTYTYQHTDTAQYAPAVVDVTAPPVTIGLGFRPTPSFALGISILPTGTGAPQNINAVPLEIEGTYQLMNIVTKNSGMKIAAGAAFRAANAFTIGAGLIRTSEKIATIATPDGSEDPLIDALYGGDSNQFIVGFRSEIIDRALVLGLSYKTAVTKPYKGDILINLSDDADYVPFEGVGYTPAAIGFGAETRFGDFGIFFDFLREMWSGGRAIAKSGLGTDPPFVDYIDSNNISGGIKFWMAKKHMLTLAFGLDGANIGDGTEETKSSGLAGDAATADDTATGVSFGQLEAIPRTILAGGYRYKLSGTGYMELGGEYQKGSRVVPANFHQEGTYTLNVLMLSFGIAYGF